MKSLMEDLNSHRLKRVYLLYGEETYLKNLYKNKLKQEILPSDDLINLSVYEGKSISSKEVIAQAETMPFFADKRLLLIENSGWFKNSCPDMADYISEIPEGTCMVFVENEVDKRGKMYKAVKNMGRVTEFGRQDEKSLMNWVLGKLRKENKNISSTTMECFLSRTGNDMQMIQNELEKLLCYTLDKDVITEKDVETVCSVQIENKIFEMIHAITEKRQKRAMDLYYDLLCLREPPLRILYLITRQFHILMQIKTMQVQGFSQSKMADSLKLQSFIVKKSISQAENFTLEELKQAVQDCVEAEEAVKTGKINDILSIEMLIMKYG